MIVSLSICALDCVPNIGCPYFLFNGAILSLLEIIQQFSHFQKQTTYRFIWKLFTFAIENSLEGNPRGVE
jgi:hypothetical protein